MTWQVPAGQAPGTYRVAVGVFSPGWASLWTWSHQAATFTVVPPPPTPASPLHVAGNQLIDAAGRPVLLHGVNHSGTEFACVQGWGMFDGPSDNAFAAAIRSWRANAVRVPLNEDCWLGINGVAPAYSGAAYQGAIRDYVNLLTQNGLYPILDLHWSAPGTTLATGQSPMPDADHSATFWSQVAQTFKDNGAVIFDLFNEPWPDYQQDSVAAWTCWRDGGTCPSIAYATVGMQALVDTVRATGAANVIALGGVSYSNALGSWLAYKPNDPLGNLAASWHVYNFNVCSSTPCFDATAAPVAAQVPLITMEIATNSCDATFFNGLMSWLDAHNASYLAWVWNVWGTACFPKSLISNYDGTPTTYGQLYRTHLLGLP
jgi:hypothetical protein